MIKVLGLEKNYGKKKVLNNINVSFPDNQINFLMGKNGAGKTTFLKCVASLERYNGKIEFVDNNDILVIWDDCPFYTDNSGIDNLVIFDEKNRNKKEIEEIVSNMIGIDVLRKKVKNYSYGQKKKLALALVELLDPCYILMDEISNGLDFDTLVELKEMIEKWKGNKNIILTGHQFSFYDGLVDNVYVIKDGLVTEYLDIKSKKLKLEDIYNETMH
ncbi:MAG: ATP-binding cassette domain-containing protein [Lachnospiraceae bacterium]|nr:ATP-binding cassette domain-containing protein [Lachnospiraceae bacterium]